MLDVHTFFEHKLEDHRYKVVRLPYHLFMEYLFNNRVKNGKIYSLKLNGIPEEGVRVQALATDPTSMCVSVRLYHPSWPVIKPCEEVPELDTMQMTQTVFRITHMTSEYEGECQAPIGTLAGLPVYLEKSPAKVAEDLSNTFCRETKGRWPIDPCQLMTSICHLADFARSGRTAEAQKLEEEIRAAICLGFGVTMAHWEPELNKSIPYFGQVVGHWSEEATHKVEEASKCESPDEVKEAIKRGYEFL